MGESRRFCVFFGGGGGRGQGRPVTSHLQTNKQFPWSRCGDWEFNNMCFQARRLRIHHRIVDACLGLAHGYHCNGISDVARERRRGVFSINATLPRLEVVRERLVRTSKQLLYRDFGTLGHLTCSPHLNNILPRVYGSPRMRSLSRLAPVAIMGGVCCVNVP